LDRRLSEERGVVADQRTEMV